MTDVFDKQELLEELDGDRDFLEESLGMLDSDAPVLLEQIRAAVRCDDADAVSTGAHTLKSMVGNFCAQPAFTAALSVETVGRSGTLGQCSELVDSLETEVGRLRKALHQLLGEIE